MVTPTSDILRREAVDLVLRLAITRAITLLRAGGSCDDAARTLMVGADAAEFLIRTGRR
jgi:hypothetical protein